MTPQKRTASTRKAALFFISRYPNHHRKGNDRETIGFPTDIIAQLFYKVKRQNEIV